MAEGGTSDANAGGRGADPLLGQVLNERYRIVDCIGAGGMGRVYRAVQMPLGRIVAIKVVIPKLAADGQDPQFLKRFFLEASITSKLSHPHTITVFDYGSTADGLVYLAMEYLQGRTLQQVIATEGPQPAPCVVQVAAQIARSLREAHGQN
ncbi:MAG: serine/threonine protein kinase, partial [Deltaproteobacteria bacterium]|nr:serine/threonine protein kinase [Deltaproteobacteria bacterium]